jgi:two-component system NarL family response regulator
VREGIALIINRQPDMTVVGLASSGEEAVELFRSLKPDVTLMDLQLGGMSGVDAIEAIRRDNPAARVVVLTMYQGDEDIYRALAAGATTYLLKDTLADDLIRVIRDVHAGLQPAVSPDLEARLAERAARPALTPREIQVLELISQGLRNKEIAIALAVTQQTVDVHVRNLLAKLDAKDRTAAVNIALRRGIIHIR